MSALESTEPLLSQIPFKWRASDSTVVGGNPLFVFTSAFVFPLASVFAGIYHRQWTTAFIWGFFGSTKKRTKKL